MQSQTRMQGGFAGREQGLWCVRARLRVSRLAFWIQSLRSFIVSSTVGGGCARKKQMPRLLQYQEIGGSPKTGNRE
jgi:hypothetical protein